LSSLCCYDWLSISVVLSIREKFSFFSRLFLYSCLANR